MKVFNFGTANETLGGRDCVKLKNNVLLERLEEKQIVIIYYATIIIRYLIDGDIILNSGGHKTKSTKANLNLYQNRGMVYQSNYEWFFKDWKEKDEPIPFENGMTI